YLRDIVTIRNKDWENLKQYFNIPNPARTIDFQRTTLKRNTVIPVDLEYHTESDAEPDNMETVKISHSSTTDLSDYQPVAATGR
ncbi:MAG: hypothetical protein LBD80_07485, partial [Tannerella sp.]|nr:hypothetical protein [Tannerella sp.]